MAAVTSQATNSQDNPLAGFGPNEWIVEDMYQRYLADPPSVDPAWHDFFADYRPSGETTTAAPPVSGNGGTTRAPDLAKAAPAVTSAAPAPAAPAATPVPTSPPPAPAP